MYKSARVVDAKPSHIVSLYPRLRKADREEAVAAGSPSALHSLAHGYFKSKPKCKSVVVGNDYPIAMFGVCPIKGETDRGAVWLLGSDEVRKLNIKFLRSCRQWIDKLNKEFKVLANIVHSKNTLHVKWLIWCGFDVRVDAPIEYNGERFYYFSRERE